MPGLADLVGLVGLQPVQRVAVFVGEDRHGLRARVRRRRGTRGWRSLRGWQQGSSETCGPLGVGSGGGRQGSGGGGPRSVRWVLLSTSEGIGRYSCMYSASAPSRVAWERRRSRSGLASAAFARGLRTLVVDLDPQSDVSTGMDIQVAGHLNVADVLAPPKEKVGAVGDRAERMDRGRPAPSTS